MSTRSVTTQTEFDQAVKDGVDYIDIVSEAGVWIAVRAYDSATVRASGSATVTASGSATVRASGSATVTAYDSATVTASGSATVTAYDSATVTASTHVAVHLHSKRVTLHGGVVIDITDLNLDDPATWAGYKGVDTAGGKAVVYKAVDAELNAGHNWTLTAYPLGGTVESLDWRANQKCGYGLHFSPHPLLAAGYYTGKPGQERFLACEIDLAETVVLDDKVKARSCRVLHEVDIHGRKIEVAS